MFLNVWDTAYLEAWHTARASSAPPPSPISASGADVSAHDEPLLQLLPLALVLSLPEVLHHELLKLATALQLLRGLNISR